MFIALVYYSLKQLQEETQWIIADRQLRCVIDSFLFCKEIIKTIMCMYLGIFIHFTNVYVLNFEYEESNT